MRHALFAPSRANAEAALVEIAEAHRPERVAADDPDEVGQDAFNTRGMQGEISRALRDLTNSLTIPSP